MSATKGPWEIIRLEILRPYSITGGTGCHLADVLWDQSAMDEDDESLANARLISAAPDLLDSLKEMRTVAATCFSIIAKNAQTAKAFAACIDGIGINDGFGGRAQAAIAKATGEQR